MIGGPPRLGQGEARGLDPRRATAVALGGAGEVGPERDRGREHGVV
jgi:hypothetical protein